MGRLLEGVRVLDLTRLLPGPLCTMHLADQGADVLKIEDPGQGDYARATRDQNGSMDPIFHALNRGKRSLILDLTQPDDRATFMTLVDSADIVVEGFRPGVMDRLGVGHEALRQRKPSLIICAMTAYGQTGPRRDEPAHDNNMLGYVGVADQFPRTENGSAGAPNFQIADISGGSLTALSAIAMALFRREQTGQGATIDVSMAEGALAGAVVPFAAMQTMGKAPRPGADQLTGALPCYGFYQTADDRQIAVGALEPKFWAAFCEAVQRPDLLAKGHVQGDEAAAAKEEVGQLFRSKSFEEWRPFLENVQACVTPVLTLDEAVADAHNRARGTFYEAADPVDGQMLRLASPFVIDEERARPTTSAPRHGEHTEDILKNGWNIAAID